MRIRIALIGLGALALSGIARADDVAAGLWELSLEARVEAEPGFQPGPMSVNQCVTREDARDPGKLLGPIAAAGASDCHYLETSYVGETFRFTMQCAGTLDLKTTGEVTMSATMLHGLLTTSSTIEGRKVEFKSTLVGRRLGNC
jgi:hypothetical protein